MISGRTIRAFLLLLSCILSVYAYIKLVPIVLGLNEDAATELRFPPLEIEDVKQLIRYIEEKGKGKGASLFLLYSGGYLIKQAYAIPGSGLMNLLGGALFGHVWGWLLVSFLTATGSTLCYLLSYALGQDLVNYFFKNRLVSLRKSIDDNKDDLLYFLLMTRLFPFTPNWFINIASPHLNIPISKFFLALLIGLAPYNFVTTGAGQLIQQIDSFNDILRVETILQLALISLALIPSCLYFKTKYSKRTKAN
ncbi:hypothetical protein MP638_001310 [Amoeboaphelidium occidentale]|nr:hypothetical protein MP638_001310 [Amoeboaphelidium occidentale]